MARILGTIYGLVTYVVFQYGRQVVTNRPSRYGDRA